MQHTIQLEKFGPEGEVMAHAIGACVHCGFCLPACPTYQVLGEEMDSPRGRIFLMKSALEGALTVEETLPFVDRCLGCLACVPACPSGVTYGELLPLYRAHAEGHRQRGVMDQFAHVMAHETLPHPDRFRIAALTGRLAQPLKRLMPEQFGAMLNLLPESLPSAKPLPELVPAVGQRRARVALLVGCVQQVLAPEINWATARVLAQNGVEVVAPRGQGCCGSLDFHTGEIGRARDLARKNLGVFPADVDAIITNAAGCGSGMKEYGVLFKGQPEAEQAGAFARRTKDVSEFLDELGLVQPPALPQPLKAAYHEACHLANAQGISAGPRRLLASIPNLTLLEIAEGEMCCGSAGTYNLEQPELAAIFGERKARNILSTGADAVVTGNIGCLIQIQLYLQKLGQPLPLYHTMEVLDQAYQASSPVPLS
jgi:glycolate oxidase iron-sulfur subunit